MFIAWAVQALDLLFAVDLASDDVGSSKPFDLYGQSFYFWELDVLSLICENWWQFIVSCFAKEKEDASQGHLCIHVFPLTYMIWSCVLAHYYTSNSACLSCIRTGTQSTRRLRVNRINWPNPPGQVSPSKLETIDIHYQYAWKHTETSLCNHSREHTTVTTLIIDSFSFCAGQLCHVDIRWIICLHDLWEDLSVPVDISTDRQHYSREISPISVNISTKNFIHGWFPRRCEHNIAVVYRKQQAIIVHVKKQTSLYRKTMQKLPALAPHSFSRIKSIAPMPRIHACFKSIAPTDWGRRLIASI